MRWTLFLLAGLVAVLLSGCADIQNSPKQSAGTLVGAGLGALAGSQIGSGSGQLAATANGTLLGAWAGSEVGKSLDRADRLAAAQATHNALEHTPTGAATTWRNPDTGHAGSVTPAAHLSGRWPRLPGLRADPVHRRPGRDSEKHCVSPARWHVACAGMRPAVRSTFLALARRG